MSGWTHRMLRTRLDVSVSVAAALIIMLALVAPAFAKDGDREQEGENSYQQTNLVSGIPGVSRVHGSKSEEPLGLVAWASYALVGFRPGHRRLDAIQRQHWCAAVTGRSDSAFSPARAPRADGHGLQCDQRLCRQQRDELRAGTLPFRDVGWHSRWLEPHR